jgi:putative transposase
MPVPDGINQCWSVDWICVQVANGRQFRVLNVVDDVSREGVVQITDFSISRGAE